jgi:hypothetical protein
VFIIRGKYDVSQGGHNMPNYTVDYKTYIQVFEVFKKGELTQGTTVLTKYKNARELMRVSGEYLKERGVDITKPLNPKDVLKGLEYRVGYQNLEAVAEAFLLSKRRVDEIREKVKQLKVKRGPNQNLHFKGKAPAKQ